MALAFLTRIGRPSARRDRTIAALALLVTVVFATSTEARDRPEGEEVVVTGSVIDVSGLPVAGVTVELRGTRRAFSLRDFRIARRGGRTVSAMTDSSGQFSLHWIWHPYYNRFDLVAGVDLSGAATPPQLRVLADVDLSKRIRTGNPVVATLEIDDRSIVDELNDFLADVDSPDESQVYQEMGKPDKVRVTTYPAWQETNWWYFELGKVYRFRDGTMTSVESFEPVGDAQE
jgi:hypothetical protein